LSREKSVVEYKRVLLEEEKDKEENFDFQGERQLLG